MGFLLEIEEDFIYETLQSLRQTKTDSWIINYADKI